VVLVGEEEEADEVPQGVVVLGKSKTRPEVERRGAGAEEVVTAEDGSQ
jgi:hypothetical protein